MIKWQRLLLLLLFPFLGGCSGFVATHNFEVVNDGTLVRYKIHDWFEAEDISVGVIRPPAYGFERTNQVYVVYPVFISDSTKLIGPPVLPLIPMSIFGDPPDPDAMVLRVRHFSKGSDRIEPTAISVYGAETTTVPLEKGKVDAVGTIFSAKLPVSESEPRFRVGLTLSDGRSRDLVFALRRDWTYSPFFSFNGPNPKPSLKRHPDDG